MSDWTQEELAEWDARICEVAKSLGLDWYPIVYEICEYYEMISSMAYHGMPSHYNHWSFGKAFENTLYRYNAGEQGLPYEMIINSNPSTAYLMRENPLYLQILIMAHCVGHSDFFKNNITFAHTNADGIIASMRAAKKKIQEHIEDPSIGVEEVERVLDGLHAISLHTEHYGRERQTHAATKKMYSDRVKHDRTGTWDHFDLNRVPLEIDYDLLGFMSEHGKHLADWERDIIDIVRNESMYFIPQMRTKIINEGFACYIHYKILNSLDLPQKFHIPFLKSHNQVVRPFATEINPYHLGLYFFNRIDEAKGHEGCLFAREVYNDESMIREMLDERACHDLGLFTFSIKRPRSSGDAIISVDDVGNEAGWKKIRENLIRNAGVNRIPKIYVENLESDGRLTLRHEHDGRDLELEYAERVVEQITKVWKRPVKLLTIIEEEDFEI
jgi:stage V sporulation protein R